MWALRAGVSPPMSLTVPCWARSSSETTPGMAASGLGTRGLSSITEVLQRQCAMSQVPWISGYFPVGLHMTLGSCTNMLLGSSRGIVKLHASNVLRRLNAPKTHCCRYLRMACKGEMALWSGIALSPDRVSELQHLVLRQRLAGCGVLALWLVVHSPILCSRFLWQYTEACQSFKICSGVQTSW